MRIDAHHHVWTLARGDYDWLTPDLTALYRDFDVDMLRPVLDIARIDATILVQAAQTEAETLFLIETARWRPRIGGVVGWTDLSAPDAADRIAELAAMPKLVGLRPMLQDLDDPEWILRAEVAPGLEAMVRHRLVFDALVRETQLPAIVTLARRHPDLSIVIDHAGKPVIGDVPSDPWLAAMTDLAALPNVTVKLSGLVTEVQGEPRAAMFIPYFQHLLDRFGAHRILWGSDWPVLTLTSDYLSWVAMTGLLTNALSAEESEAIWGGTAARIYGIGIDDI